MLTLFVATFLNESDVTERYVTDTQQNNVQNVKLKFTITEMSQSDNYSCNKGKPLKLHVGKT